MKYLVRALVAIAVWTVLLEPAARAHFGPSYERCKQRFVSWAQRTVRDLPRISETMMPSGSEKMYEQKWRDGIVIPKDIDSREVRWKVAKIASTFVGTPYVLGGEGSTGIDCSGLVVAAYRRSGISVPHKSRLLFKMGEAASLAGLRQGDLVFFHNSNGPAGHVGIYVGGGKVVHASSSRRRVVIDELTQMAAVSGLTGARALLK